MKENFRIVKIIALFTAAVALSSCDNVVVEPVETTASTTQTADSKARLCVSVGGNSMRTILPADITEAQITRAELLAKASGADSASLVKEWTSDSTASAIGKMTADTEILIDAGTYDFTLNLYAPFNGTQTLCQRGTLANVTVAAGANPLAFSARYVADGTGTLALTLTWTADDRIASVQAGLFTAESGGETAAAGYEMTEIAISGDEESGFSATYAKNTVPSGTYFVRFLLYAADGTKINTLEEVAKIASACTTSKTVALSNVNTIYAITYNLNGGTWAAGFTAPKSRNANKAVMLPAASDLTRTGYDFAGWYKGDTSDEANKVTEIASGSTGDVTLTAGWTPTVYTITYILGDDEENAESNPITYTIESDTITLATPTCTTEFDTEYNSTIGKWVYKSEAVFVGWFENPDFEGEAVTELKSGSTGNKTLYSLFLIYRGTKVFREEIGDIVFESGKVTDVENYKAHKEIYERVDGKPVGIVAFHYKAALGTSEKPTQNGAGNANLGQTYMVGLYLGENLALCTQNADAYSFINNICTMGDSAQWKEVHKLAGKVLFSKSSDSDGSDNWTKIKNSYKDTDDATKYPAFYFAENYGQTAGLSGEYAEGWYIPSITELNYIWAAQYEDSLDAVLGEKRQIYSGGLWSSSSSRRTSDGTTYEWYVSGQVLESKKDAQKTVIVVRPVKKDAYKTE